MEANYHRCYGCNQKKHLDDFVIGGPDLCIKCSSKCFDCGKEYPNPILTEDNEPWCQACINLFNTNRDAWRDRWFKNHNMEVA